ncbi:MAG: hypothetical protein NZ707_06100, partial [Rhodospirillales bacterium]|nr:hypothetical protein [Rhodospirillales bacterium]
IAITGQRGGSQVIRNNEENIVFLRSGKSSDYKEKEREDGWPFLVHVPTLNHSPLNSSSQ